MLKRKIRAYLSHPIRGVYGDKCPEEQIKFNCQQAIAWAKALRIYFGCNLEIHVPAEHDEHMLIAMKKGYLTIDQVLDIDCVIVSRRDVVLIANWEDHISGGMRREIDTAYRRGIPYRVFTDVQEDDLRALKMWLEQL